eukprot:s265_g32.t1
MSKDGIIALLHEVQLARLCPCLDTEAQMRLLRSIALSSPAMQQEADSAPVVIPLGLFTFWQAITSQCPQPSAQPPPRSRANRIRRIPLGLEINEFWLKGRQRRQSPNGRNAFEAQARKAPTSRQGRGSSDIISAGYIDCEYGRRPALQLKVCVTPKDPSAQNAMGAPGSGLCLSSLDSAAKLFPGPTGSIRVGRSMQAPEFWSSLVPDETLRNAVSRQHFEIASKGGKLMLTNLSLAGTLLNGHMVQQHHKVQHGDVVAIPLHGRVHEAPPIVQFRVECKGASIEAPRFCDASDSHTAGAELVPGSANLLQAP